MRCLIRAPLAAFAITLAACTPRTPASGAESPAPAAVEPAANPFRNAYFGDLHLHTRLSLDAYLYDIETLPEDAYRYARGEAVRYMGREVRRRTPLDFLAVTDHAEYLGALHLAALPDGPFAGTEWQRLVTTQDASEKSTIFWKFNRGRPAELRTPEIVHSMWQAVIDAAQKHYQPGRFTTFVAFEWSASPNMQNLHRNVLFAGPQFPERPFSSHESARPEDLWGYLEDQRGRGVDGLAIPHNSNLSNGLMFDYVDSDGRPLSRAYAERRMRNEPDVEISQAKGTSETTPELAPADEFAAFEVYRHMLGGQPVTQLEGGYVRNAFARGIEIQEKIGVNPFKYGLIGGSDFHSGVSSTEEDNYPGAHGKADSATHPAAVLSAGPLSVGAPPAQFSASGLTGVWAEQNTRESIFAALRRKETFATSGGRIGVRMFAGWRYPKGAVRRRDWIAAAYAQGVPMGSDLPPRPANASSPRFLLHAIKDPDAANLDRIQIVKVWFDHGRSGERVFDVAWSGERAPDAKTGRVPAVGSTVDVKTATYRNSIGAAQLIGEWTDPEFDPSTPAVFYARVLEIPTPRWTTYLAVRNRLPLPDKVPAAIQERAWTSPVFYEPAPRRRD
jgi:hypothetical protein